MTDLPNGVLNNSNFERRVVSPEFRTLVALGKIPGARILRKFAEIPSLIADVERDIWDFGSNVAPGANLDYTYPDDETAPINTVSSSSALDTGNLVVIGLDISGLEVTQVITLNGQNKVSLGVPLYRVYRMFNIQASTSSDRSLHYQGTIYCYEDVTITGGVPDDLTKVRAIINNGNNQTLMSQFTVPLNETGVVYRDRIGLSRRQAASATIRLRVRPYGSVWSLQNVADINSQGNTSIQEASRGPERVPSGTDAVITAESDTTGIGISARYDMVLFNNDIRNL